MSASYVSYPPLGVAHSTPALATFSATSQAAPAAPGSLGVVGVTSTSVALTWTAAARATGYLIYGPGGVLLATLPFYATSYTIGGLTPLTSYIFQVVSYNSTASAGSSVFATTASDISTAALNHDRVLEKMLPKNGGSQYDKKWIPPHLSGTNWIPGYYETHCNWFASDAVSQLGGYLPNFVANEQRNWLEAQSQNYVSRWKKTSDARSAQMLANQGYIVVAVWKNTVSMSVDGLYHGHIAVLKSQSMTRYSNGNGPQTAQAGLLTSAYMTVLEGFTSAYKPSVEYYYSF